MHLIYLTCQIRSLSPASLKPAQNPYITRQVGTFLECQLKNHCPSFLLLRSWRHRWHFVDVVGCINTKHNIQKRLQHSTL